MARFDLNGATAIVTGGSRGVGPFIATALAERGARTSPQSIPWNSAAATPTTVIGKPFTSTFRPTTSSRPPRWFFQ